METVNEQILAELQGLRQLLAEKAATPAAPLVPEAPAESGMMTDYDCLLICTSDDVLGAIDRWNKSRKKPAARRAR